MNLCDTYIFLKLFMYIKYVVLFTTLFSLLIYVKNKNNLLVKKTIKILFLLIIIYFILLLTFNIFNINFKKCFNNSNPYQVEFSKKLSETYNSDTDVNTTDEYLENVEPQLIKKITGGKKIYMYNQNSFPLSNYGFTLYDTTDEYLIKKSGNEITTLASLITTLVENTEIDPIEIIKKLKKSDLDFSNGIDINSTLQYLSQYYEYYYKPIPPEYISNGIEKGGIILVKVKGMPSGKIFTCTEGYILIYGYDNSNNFLVMSTNDKNYDYICPVGTNGFGNVVNSNINSTFYNYGALIENPNYEYYLIWR